MNFGESNENYVTEELDIDYQFLFRDFGIASISPLVSLFQADPDIQKPWEYYATKLQSELNGKEDWSFLHISVTQDYLDWHDAEFGAFFQYKFSDSMPLYQGRYVPSPISFFDAYRFIVLSYAIEFSADKTLQALAREKSAKLGRASRDLSDGWAKIGRDWVEFDRIQRKSHIPEHRLWSYDKWYAEIGRNRILPLESRVTIALGELQSVYSKMGLGAAELAKAISEVNNRAHFLQAKAPDKTEFSYPIYNVSPSLAGFIDATKQQIRQNPDHIGFEISFSSVSGRYAETNTSFGANGGFSLGGGVMLNVGGKWEERTINTSSSNFAVKLTFAGFQKFTFEPGGWYSAAVLRLVENGPWVKDSFVDRWISQGKPVFGRNGLLPLQNMVAYVGLQSKLVVSLETHDYSYCKKVFDLGGNVSFLGIPLGGGGGRREELTITWHDNVNSVSISDNSGKPVLIAVQTQEMPPHV